MNGRTVKKIRKEMIRARGQHFKDTWNALCGLPLRARMAVAWKIVRKQVVA